MKALSVHGPWAYFERKNADNEARIAQLETEVTGWRDAAERAEAQLAEAQQQNERMQRSTLPELQAESSRAQQMVHQLQSELLAEQQGKSDTQAKLLKQVQVLTEELGKVNADNAVLRAELAKTVHTKATTSSKLDQIRKKLGLTELEAKEFLQELDDTRASNKALKEENGTLTADKAHLQQQLESRSQHCMTLIADNKRLMGQVSEMRNQLQKMDGELWQTKQELGSAAKQLQARKPTVVKERPQWVEPKQGGAGTAGTSSSGCREAAAAQSQNRPPWADTARPKVVRAQVGVSPLPLTDNDNVKAEAVRQALAMRQQRLAGPPR